jgi:hypothetical protein
VRRKPARVAPGALWRKAAADPIEVPYRHALRTKGLSSLNRALGSVAARSGFNYHFPMTTSSAGGEDWHVGARLFWSSGAVIGLELVGSAAGCYANNYPE